MDRRITDAYEGRTGDGYILPFFWQHGEEHRLLEEEIDAIQRCGIGEFCVESRIHPKFCEEKWWEDLGFILGEARRRGMRVWLLDDKRFPSGYANNYIESHPELRARFLWSTYRDYAGPRRGAALLPTPKGDGQRFVSVTAYRRDEGSGRIRGDGVPLLQHYRDGLIRWDIPDGLWRVYYVADTHNSESSGRLNYVDMLSAKSCHAMIDGVYQPHYEHFSEYFGSVFAGFFSDEPGFGNESGYYGTLGREGTILPWSDALLPELCKRSGFSQERLLALLPGLWHDVGHAVHLLRYAYMDAASDAYSRSFSRQLGDWCRAHGVEYIGHVIEDNNAHQRLGYGAGHFFRSMAGQDMAGCDIVLHQIAPGQYRLPHAAAIDGGADPKFFNVTLPKLTASLAHIQPLKKGRALCEIFGAFGWAEGVPTMKYLADLMLVSGINRFVPHAFTPKENDPDCPPHFYARGRNPQFPAFVLLIGYMKRMAHILSGGVHQPDVAVYYNAEAEWSGGKSMLQQEVCDLLTRNRLDYDLLPMDALLHAAEVDEGVLRVGSERYGALLVPYSQYLPLRLIERLGELSRSGLAILFADTMPDSATDGTPVGETLALCEALPLLLIPAALEARGMRSVSFSSSTPALRFYHLRRDCDIYMLWNEDTAQELDCIAQLPGEGRAVLYDVWQNRLLRPQEDGGVRIRLAPGEAVVIFFDGGSEEYPPFDYRDAPRAELEAEWLVSLSEDGLGFREYYRGAPRDLAPELPRFCGVVRYETTVVFDFGTLPGALELDDAGETASLTVNGCDCGTAVRQPYRFDISGCVRRGENSIVIDITANPGYRERDFFSSFLPLPPTGLCGKVYII